MTVRDISDAISAAKEALRELSPEARDVSVEEAVVSENEQNIEVTLSYVEGTQSPENLTTAAQLLSILGDRRKWRIFIIRKNSNKFLGFKAYRKSEKR